MTRRTLAAAAASLLVPLWVIAQSSHLQRRQRAAPVPPAAIARTTGPVSQGDIAAVLLAIKDEIYAGGCAAMFADIGRPKGEGERQINVYFQPKLNEGMSSVIYKFWPFGEVVRTYWMDKGGMAHLMGHPRWGFPPTEPSYLTIYIGDHELCHTKSTWTRVPLEIKLAPASQQVREADRRQVERGGDLHVCQGRWQGNIFIPQQ